MEIALKIILFGSLAVFALLFVFSLVIFAVHHRTGGALFVPTPKVMIREIVQAIDFSVFHDIRDIGAGDGRFMSAVEREYGVSVRGYEINPIAFVLAKVLLLNRKSSVLFKDFWNEDFSGADCVYCYLFPDLMRRLGEKLSRELPDGAMVISANFPVPFWKEERIIKAIGTIFNDPVYVYRMSGHTPED